MGRKNNGQGEAAEQPVGMHETVLHCYLKRVINAAGLEASNDSGCGFVSRASQSPASVPTPPLPNAVWRRGKNQRADTSTAPPTHAVPSLPTPRPASAHGRLHDHTHRVFHLRIPTSSRPVRPSSGLSRSRRASPPLTCALTPALQVAPALPPLTALHHHSMHFSTSSHAASLLARDGMSQYSIYNVSVMDSQSTLALSPTNTSTTAATSFHSPDTSFSEQCVTPPNYPKMVDSVNMKNYMYLSNQPPAVSYQMSHISSGNDVTCEWPGMYGGDTSALSLYTPSQSFLSADSEYPLSPHTHQEWMAFSAQERGSRGGCLPLSSKLKTLARSTPSSSAGRGAIRKHDPPSFIPPGFNLETADKWIALAQGKEQYEALKAEKRKLRNRQSAARSRQQKKEKIEGLEEKKEKLTDEVAKLEDEIHKLREEVKRREKEVQRREKEVEQREKEMERREKEWEQQKQIPSLNGKDSPTISVVPDTIYLSEHSTHREFSHDQASRERLNDRQEQLKKPTLLQGERFSSNLVPYNAERHHTEYSVKPTAHVVHDVVPNIGNAFDFHVPSTSTWCETSTEAHPRHMYEKAYWPDTTQPTCETVAVHDDPRRPGQSDGTGV